MKDIEIKNIKMDCLEVNKVSPYIDGNLSFDQKKKFDNHLQNCEICFEIMNKKILLLEKTKSLIPEKYLSPADQNNLELEITELYNSFTKKSKIKKTTRKLINKVLDIF